MTGPLPAAGPSASQQDSHTGLPLDRNQVDAHLWSRLDRASRSAPRLPLLTEEEATVVATLLDELAAVYAGEQLGNTARELAVRLWDRAGSEW